MRQGWGINAYTMWNRIERDALRGRSRPHLPPPPGTSNRPHGAVSFCSRDQPGFTVTVMCSASSESASATVRRMTVRSISLNNPGDYGLLFAELTELLTARAGSLAEPPGTRQRCH
jgi:hypothetical protein